MNDDEYAKFLRQELARLEAADEPLRRAAAELAKSPLLLLVPTVAAQRWPDRPRG